MTGGWIEAKDLPPKELAAGSESLPSGGHPEGTASALTRFRRKLTKKFLDEINRNASPNKDNTPHLLDGP